MDGVVLVSSNAYSVRLSQIIAVFLILGAVYLWYSSRKDRYTSEERRQRKALQDGFERVHRSRPLSVSDAERWGVDRLIDDESTRRAPAKLCDLYERKRLTPTIRAGCIRDADGRDLYVAYVADMAFAHRDRDVFVSDVVSAAEDIDAGDDVEPSFAEWWYSDEVVDGRVDIEESRDRLAGDCLTRCQMNIRRATKKDHMSLISRMRSSVLSDADDDMANLALTQAGIDAATLREEMVYEYGYPEDVFEDQMRILLLLGEVQRVADKYQYARY